jgi:hypothetical protein
MIVVTSHRPSAARRHRQIGVARPQRSRNQSATSTPQAGTRRLQSPCAADYAAVKTTLSGIDKVGLHF